MKTCPKCGLTKDESEFYHYKNIGRYSHECKTCKGSYFNRLSSVPPPTSNIRCYACGILIGKDYIYKKPKTLFACGEKRVFDKDCYKYIKSMGDDKDAHLYECGFFNINDEDIYD